MTLHARGIRQDVRELGTLVGNVIAAQTSSGAFQLVERLRTGSIEYRRGDAETREPVRAAVSNASVGRAETVARAFTTYFELINLAEERERVREVRRGRAGGEIGESVAAAV